MPKGVAPAKLSAPKPQNAVHRPRLFARLDAPPGTGPNPERTPATIEAAARPPTAVRRSRLVKLVKAILLFVVGLDFPPTRETRSRVRGSPHLLSSTVDFEARNLDG